MAGKKNKCLAIPVLFLIFAACQSPPVKEPIDYVDPFIGTSNSRWMLGPYATLPFGMVQLGPDNQGDHWMGGYEYAIHSIAGFSHIHAWTMGGLRIMPTTIDLVTEDRPVDAPYKGAQAGYHSRILKNREKAAPGYYKVYLYDHEVLAEMTVGKRTGFMRFTFPACDEARVLVDLQIPSEYRYRVVEGSVKRLNNQELEGFAQSQVSNWNDYILYFVLRFDTPFARLDGFQERDVKRDISEISGEGDLGAFVTFHTNPGQVIQMQSGLSLVSIDQARLNLEKEMDPFEWDFRSARDSSAAVWNELLSRIQVKTTTEKDKIRFYTNLYRAYCAKQTWNDVNGKYRDPGETVRQLEPDREMYGGDAFWNSYWNLNTLWTLVTPRYADNYVSTQLELFKNTGWTSKGPTGLEYSGIMVGNHEMALMVSTYQKGIRMDGKAIYSAILKNVTVNREGTPCNGYPGNDELKIYRHYGYIPYDLGFSSNMLDYAYDDWVVAQMAQAVGDRERYEYLIEQSQNYHNIFHPEYKFFVPRDSKGEWIPDFDEFSNKSFIEGNSWQYLWYIPHDIPGLVELLGKDLFNDRLEKGFVLSEPHKFAAHAFDRTAGQRAEYYINHSNQVNMQAAWLFNFSGKPWLTQKYTQAILESFYGDSPYHGWEGDEDEGQMGGWFVISSLGLFEMDGACSQDPVLELSSPLFEKITIYLDPNYYPGETFVIKANKLSKTNIYIQSARLNGEPLNRCWISFKDVVAGGVLEYEMGPEPNLQWGKR
jgi:predicted alpha-1,2-mannosidase